MVMDNSMFGGGATSLKTKFKETKKALALRDAKPMTATQENIWDSERKPGAESRK